MLTENVLHPFFTHCVTADPESFNWNNLPNKVDYVHTYLHIDLVRM